MIQAIYYCLSCRHFANSSLILRPNPDRQISMKATQSRGWTFVRISKVLAILNSPTLLNSTSETKHYSDKYFEVVLIFSVTC